jgi:hypothetical protein
VAFDRAPIESNYIRNSKIRSELGFRAGLGELILMKAQALGEERDRDDIRFLDKMEAGDESFGGGGVEMEHDTRYSA